MAYAALDSLAKYLGAILEHRFCRYCSCVSDIEYCILLQKKQRIQRLHENIVFLLYFLSDFPREADKIEARVTIAANQATTLFHNGIPLAARECADHSSKTFFQELEKIIVETDSIREEATHIKSSRKIRMPSRLAGGDGVVGIEEDLLEIKSRLCGGSSQLGIIPIVGMGGIGKTTLARYAFDDPLSVHHFDVRVWLTISQSYNLKGILRTALRSIKDENVYWHIEEELLKERIYRYLKGRRYLIVMDDMWDTNLWDDLRRMFPDDLNGSRIIITARELNIVSYIDSLIQPHQMRLMSVDQSWKLLKEKVFGHESSPLELQKIGQVIAEKCRGLPLAVIVIAGVLSYKVDQMKDSWENIARNASEVVNTNDEQFIDYEINVTKLIRLWAAEGFLTSNESKDMEDLGYEYLEDLATRSLVFINKRGSDGNIKTVKIHDVLRDLCLRKCRDENFLCTINEFSGSFPQGIENSNRQVYFVTSPVAFQTWRVHLCIPSFFSSSGPLILGKVVDFSGYWMF